MSKSKIEWTDVTWNPVTGCTPVSEGCKNCYARTFAGKVERNERSPIRAGVRFKALAGSTRYPVEMEKTTPDICLFYERSLLRICTESVCWVGI